MPVMKKIPVELTTVVPGEVRNNAGMPGKGFVPRPDVSTSPIDGDIPPIPKAPNSSATPPKMRHATPKA